MPHKDEPFANPQAPANYHPDEIDQAPLHPLSNDDFRKLLMTPAVGTQRSSTAILSSSQAKPVKTSTEKDAEAGDRRKKKKLHYAKFIKEEKQREEERINKYRDRARERRDRNKDLEDPGVLPIQSQSQSQQQLSAPTTSAGNYRAVAPDAKGNYDAAARRKQIIEESKFLGGDLEHTHLVKGLDYALLQKIRAEITTTDEFPDQSGADDNEQSLVKPMAPPPSIPTSTASDKKKAIPTKQSVQKPTIAQQQQQRQQMIEDEEENRLGIKSKLAKNIFRTLFRNNILNPQLNQRKINELFLPHRMAYVIDLESDQENQNGLIDDIPTTLIRSKTDCPNADVNVWIDLYDDVGDYVPDTKRRDIKDEQDKNRRKNYFSGLGDEQEMDRRNPSNAMEDDDHSENNNGEAVKNFIKNVHRKYENKSIDSRNGGKKSGFQLKFSDDSYAECYPGTMAEEDVNIDSDDEPDYEKMDMGSKKGPIGRWDFDTAEEYSDYMSQKEAMPKAAFQYGVKMSDGRKTRKSGPQDEKQKLEREWQQISKIIDKRKGGGGGDENESYHLKYSYFDVVNIAEENEREKLLSHHEWETADETTSLSNASMKTVPEADDQPRIPLLNVVGDDHLSMIVLQPPADTQNLNDANDLSDTPAFPRFPIDGEFITDSQSIYSLNKDDDINSSTTTLEINNDDATTVSISNGINDSGLLDQVRSLLRPTSSLAYSTAPTDSAKKGEIIISQEADTVQRSRAATIIELPQYQRQRSIIDELTPEEQKSLANGLRRSMAMSGSRRSTMVDSRRAATIAIPETEKPMNNIDTINHQSPPSFTAQTQNEGFLSHLSGILWAFLTTFSLCIIIFITKAIGLDLLFGLLLQMLAQTVAFFVYAIYKNYNILGPQGYRLRIILRGLMMAIGTSTIYLAYYYISLPGLSVIRQSQIVWTIILALIFLKERITIPRIVAFILTMIAVILIGRQTLLFRENLLPSEFNSTLNTPFSSFQFVKTSSYLFGSILVLIATIAFSISIILNKILLNAGLHTSILCFWSSAFSLVISIILVIYTHFIIGSKSVPHDWRLFTGFGLALASIFVFIGNQKALKREKVTIVTLTYSIDIVLALFLQNIFRNSKSDWIAYLGCAFILMSIITICIDVLIEEKRKQKVTQKVAAVAAVSAKYGEEKSNINNQKRVSCP
ncbi:unnamed protein product [Didymodactylos carnosus]|uniref:Protein Red n=1 Tax=Didymodactylos carnosus TaxID=1234261 RepID=A0A8S2IRC3_9BILA|nr:unnamed protein product [Didymodactylos carnosus]CAF3771063.1 unnamed protein product [Didymodactylos carnosus]